MPEIIHKEGKLYDMICDNMVNFVERKHIRQIIVRSNDAGEQWAILQTDLGSAYIIEWCDLRKWRLEYLINKNENKGSQ